MATPGVLERPREQNSQAPETGVCQARPGHQGRLQGDSRCAEEGIGPGLHWVSWARHSRGGEFRVGPLG